MPAFVWGSKVGLHEVTQHRSHGNFARTPSWKIKREFVILHILVAGDWVLYLSGHEVVWSLNVLTVWKWPPPRCPATAFAIEGFSATQSTLVTTILPENRCRLRASGSHILLTMLCVFSGAGRKFVMARRVLWSRFDWLNQKTHQIFIMTSHWGLQPCTVSRGCH